MNTEGEAASCNRDSVYQTDNKNLILRGGTTDLSNSANYITIRSEANRPQWLHREATKKPSFAYKLTSQR